MDNIQLYLGDCLEEMKKIPDYSVDLVLTDLPYGTTQNTWDSIIDFPLMWAQVLRISKAKAALAFFAAEPFGSKLRMSNLRDYKHDWVWVKENGTGFLNAKKYPLYNNEQIAIFCQGTPNYYPQMRQGYKPYIAKQGAAGTNYGKTTGAVSESDGERYPLNTIEFQRDPEKVHPTQKPVDLLEYLIKTYTIEGETVLDFTMGSGSTGVAAKKLKRNFIGIEKDPNYYQIAKRRIENGESCYQMELA